MLPIKSYSQVFLFLFVAMILLPGELLSQWNYVGPAGISYGWSMYNDIVVDTSGAPVITYYESPMIPSPVLRWNGSQWTQLGGGTYFFPASAGDNQLLVGPDGSISLYFLDIGVYRPSVIRFRNGGWSYVGGSSLFTSTVNNFSMDYDSAGKLYGAFTSSSGFKLLKENGNAWDTVVTTGLPSPLAYPFIRFSPSGDLYMAFTEMNTLKVECRKLVGSQWQQVGAAGLSSGFAQYNKLLFTNSGQLYLAYDDGLTVVKHFDGSTWDTVGVAGLGTLTNGLEDLIADANGHLYLSTSRIAGDHARCYKWDGSVWGQVGPASGINDTTAGFPNIALGPDGTLYATYNDFEIEKAVVKSFAGAVGVAEQESGIDIQLAPNPGQDVFRVIGSPSEECLYRVWDAWGRQMASGEVDGGAEVSSTSWPTGIYWIAVHKRSGGVAWTGRWVKQ